MITTTHVRQLRATRSGATAQTTWLRIQYLIGFGSGTVVVGLMPGAMLGLLLGGVPGAIDGALDLLPLGVMVALPVMSIWLVGAMGTASAIERLHR